MSDRGDHRDDDLEPADPWGLDDLPPPEASDEGGPRAKRRRRRRRASEGGPAEPAEGTEPAEAEDAPEPDLSVEQDETGTAGDDESPEVPGPAPESDEGRLAKRRRRRRRRQEAAAEAAEPPEDMTEAGEDENLVADQPAQPSGADAATEGLPAAEPGEVPSPAGDEPIVVETPAWADDMTAGAEHVRAEGFDEQTEVADEPPVDGAAVPDAAAEGGPPDTEEGEAEGDPGEEPEGPSDAGDDAEEDWARALAGQSPYGVPTPEAFAALAGDDLEDTGDEDWESFIGEEAAERRPDPTDPGVPYDQEAEGEPVPLSRRERRRARKEAKAARRAAKRAEVEEAPGEPSLAGADGVGIPAWVEGEPDDTEWLSEGLGEDQEASPAAASSDEGWPPDERVSERDIAGDVGRDQAPLPLDVEASDVAESDEEEVPVAAEDAGPIPADPDTTVWLAADQPLVEDEPGWGESADDEVVTGAGPEAEQWFADEEVEGGGAGEAEELAEEAEEATGEAEEFWDDEDLSTDEWVAEPVDRFGDPMPEAAQPVGEDEVELADDVYGAATVEHRGLAEEIFRAGEEETEWQAVSAAMPGLGTGVVGFEDVADLGTDEEEYVERARSDLGVRIFTGLVLAGLLVGSLWVGPEAFAIFAGLLILVALGEYYTALRIRRFRPIALFGYLGGIGVLAGTWYHGPVAIPLAVVLTGVFTFFVYAFVPLGRDALTNGGLTVLGVAWITGTAAFAFPIVQAEGFRALVLTVVAITVAMDIGAYAVGRLWGSTPLAPVLSPNKTVEGLVGGVAVAAGAAVGAGALFEEIATGDALVLAAVAAVLVPLGDLAESMLKRSLVLKDMGTILPGHGGILDRIDGFLFALPGMWVAAKVLELIP